MDTLDLSYDAFFYPVLFITCFLVYQIGFNYLKFLDELQPSEIQEQKYLKRIEELKLVNKEKVKKNERSTNLTMFRGIKF